jgi:hypothetical protein
MEYQEFEAKYVALRKKRRGIAIRALVFMFLMVASGAIFNTLKVQGQNLVLAATIFGSLTLLFIWNMARLGRIDAIIDNELDEYMASNLNKEKD